MDLATAATLSGGLEIIRKGAEELQKIKDLANKIRNKEAVLDIDPEDIKTINIELTKPENQMIKKYVKNESYKQQMSLGLYLRRLSEDKELFTKLEKTRTSIMKKYGKEGLRRAELVQSGMYKEILGLISSKSMSENELINKLDDFLLNIEKNTTFVKSEDDSSKLARIILMRLETNLPPAYIVFCYGAAIENGEKLRHQILSEGFQGYRMRQILDAPTLEQKYYLLLIKDDYC
jgi:hypothetical protein